MNTRVIRTNEQLLERLRQHTDLLEEYHQQACREGKPMYFGEIAGKLRVLTYKSRTNRPLLLDLMSDYSCEVPITIDKPWGKQVFSVVDYLQDLACVIRLPSDTLAELSRIDLIALWAQQSGASHEDWELDERLAAIFDSGLRVGGLPIEAQALCGICRTVLFVSNTFLAERNESQAEGR